MPNDNGLIECRSVCSTGAPDSNFYVRKIISQDVNCNDLTVNDDATIGGDTVMNGAVVKMTALPNTTIPGTQTGQRGTQTQRPVMVDSVSGALTKPSQPMIRFFAITTPSATGSPVLVQDAASNTYNANNWTVFPVGFSNQGGDRTYNCYCFFDVNRNWYVQYDQAGGNGVVNLCAIHNSMYVDGSN